MGSASASSLLTSSKSLPFEKVAHKVSTLDAQPSNETGGIIVMVTGALQVCRTTILQPNWQIKQSNGRLIGG